MSIVCFCTHPEVVIDPQLAVTEWSLAEAKAHCTCRGPAAARPLFRFERETSRLVHDWLALPDP